MLDLIESAGIRLWKSDMITCPHGFSTRLGGVSAGYLGEFNFAMRHGETAEALAENRRRFAGALGARQDALCSARQTHSTVILRAECPLDGVECDGFVTDVPGLLLTVKTADCLPILLYEPEAGICAAIHAGWRGSFAGIARKGTEAVEALGGARERIIAALGPCICRDCFEVGDELVVSLCESLGEEAAAKYAHRVPGGRYHIDLRGLNAWVLRESGVPAESIDISPECTCCNPGLYHSHRRDGERRGVMAAGIMLP